MTFLITNDSAKYSNLQGTWDLCCRASDYGNFILTLNGYKPYESSTPSLYVNVDGKEIKSVDELNKAITGADKTFTIEGIYPGSDSVYEYTIQKTDGNE